MSKEQGMARVKKIRHIGAETREQYGQQSKGLKKRGTEKQMHRGPQDQRARILYD